jgi:bacteriocin leader peptide (microcyclamide/patellamide family)
VKTLRAQKNLMPQVAGPVNGTTTGELPAAELVELSEEALQQIVGGAEENVINDPLFFVHHVFIDLSWHEWQRRFPTPHSTYV